MNEYSNENKPFKKRQRFLTAPPAPPGFTIGRATGRSTGPASRSLTMRTSPRISKLQKSFLKISEKNNLKTTIDEINIIKNSYPYNKSYDAVLAFLQSKLSILFQETIFFRRELKFSRANQKSIFSAGF